MDHNFKQLLLEIEHYLTPGATRNDVLAYTCKLLKDNVSHYSWVGFYLAEPDGSMLHLGAYSGKATEHTAIPFGKGVCGQVAETKTLKIVQDVRLEGNYISCSIDVRSEIVVPVMKGDKFVAEIDIDSHAPAPFTIADEQFLTALCQKLAVLF